MRTYVLNKCIIALGEQNHSQQPGTHEKSYNKIKAPVACSVRKQTSIKDSNVSFKRLLIITELNERMYKIVIEPQKTDPY